MDLQKKRKTIDWSVNRKIKDNFSSTACELRSEIRGIFDTFFIMNDLVVERLSNCES